MSVQYSPFPALSDGGSIDLTTVNRNCMTHLSVNFLDIVVDAQFMVL